MRAWPLAEVLLAVFLAGCGSLDRRDQESASVPSEAQTVDALANGTSASLPGLCDHGYPFSAKSEDVALRGWEKRLNRLGLRCVRDGTTLRSITPNGIPFAISVVNLPLGPGDSASQFLARIDWDDIDEAKRGRASLLAAEKARPGRAD